MKNQYSAENIIYDSYFKAKETINKENNECLDWITDIKENPNRGKKDRCEICGSKENLELHHVRGRKNGNEVITVCRECHQELTRNQNLWDKRCLNGDPGNDWCLVLGLINILELKYEKTGIEIYKIWAKKLKERFHYE